MNTQLNTKALAAAGALVGAATLAICRFANHAPPAAR